MIYEELMKNWKFLNNTTDTQQRKAWKRMKRIS